MSPLKARRHEMEEAVFRVAPLPAEVLTAGAVCVGTEGNVGLWNPRLGRWGDLGAPGGTRIRSLADGPDGRILAVNADGNVLLCQPDRWTGPSRMGNWAIATVAWRPDRVQMCVDTAGRIGMFGTDRWFEQANGGWKMKMLTWDIAHRMMGVGANGNVGWWNGSGWTDHGLLGGWTLKMLAWDIPGRLWGVGTEGNVGCWSGEGWTNFGRPGGWTLDWLLFT